MPSSAEAVQAASKMLDWLFTEYADQIRARWRGECADLADRRKYSKGSKIAHLNCDRVLAACPDILCRTRLHKPQVPAQRSFEYVVALYHKLRTQLARDQAAFELAQKKDLSQHSQDSHDKRCGFTPIEDLDDRENTRRLHQEKGRIALQRLKRRVATLKECL